MCAMFLVRYVVKMSVMPTALQQANVADILTPLSVTPVKSVKVGRYI